MKGQKTGGRQKGTPNKNNPFRAPLSDLCLDYLTRKDQTVTLPDGSVDTVFASQMELDLNAIEDPKERLNAMLRVLKFVTPEMKSVDMDMTVEGDTNPIIDRLSGLIDEDIS